MDISITAPRTRSLVTDMEAFSEWKRIIKEQKQQYIYFRLGWLPAQNESFQRCFVIHKGAIRGYFRIKGFMNIVRSSEDMLNGRYLMLITASWQELKPIKARGHRNFKYMQDIEIIRQKGQNLLLLMYEELERRCQGRT